MADEQRPAPIYHLRVQGNLDSRWADWFAGFVMHARANGQTLLSGTVVDQAALHGALAKIRGLDLPLLLVVHTPCPCTRQGCLRRGQCAACAAYNQAQGQLPYCFRLETRWDRRWTRLTALV